MAKKVNGTLLVLTKAFDIVQNHWTRGTLAKNAKGKTVSVNSPGAVSFCAVGALRKAELVTGKTGEAANARRVLASCIPSSGMYSSKSIMNFNDSRGKAAVVKLFQKAIAKVTA